MTKNDAMDYAFQTWCQSVASELRSKGYALEIVTNERDLRRAFDSGNDSVKLAGYFARKTELAKS